MTLLQVKLRTCSVVSNRIAIIWWVKRNFLVMSIISCGINAYQWYSNPL
ncbi:MAG: hypothetical protein JWQ54_2120 [Mucilaginibacter sp.]|nr:hypothetical protein [Mucilaginibacter sp.]